MPRYAGDQIYQGGSENGNVTTTALNYRRTAASSNFGTRKLAWYTVCVNQDLGVAANYAENNSLYYQMVRAIQQGDGIGGIDAPTEHNGDIRGGGGGGAELFYVGLPQNSSSSPLNQQDNWYTIKPTAPTSAIDVTSASGDGTTATLTFTTVQGAAPFNVGDAVEVQNVGSGYDCVLIDQHFVTECTTTYVKYNSTATATLTSLEASVYADLGYDCFTFAIVDDAEPFLPLGSGYFGDTDFSGVAGDYICYCNISIQGNTGYCASALNLSDAIRQVLVDNDLNGSDFTLFRLQESFGLLQF